MKITISDSTDSGFVQETIANIKVVIPGVQGAPGPSDHTLLSNIGTRSHLQLESDISDRVPYAGAAADINLGNTQKVTNMQDPTLDQDAATKKYVDDSIDTREPSITAGTASQYWRGDKTFQNVSTIVSGYVPYTGATSNINLNTRSILMPSGTLKDAAGFDAFAVNNRALFTASGIPNVQFGTYELWDSTAANAVLNWDTKIFYDGGGFESLLFGDRRLVDSTGIIALDWAGSDISVNNKHIIDVADPINPQDAVTLAYGQSNFVPYSGAINSVDLGGWNLSANQLNSNSLVNLFGQVILDLSGFTAYDGSFTASINLATRQIFDSSATFSGDYNYRQLVDTSGLIVALDWSTRNLLDDFGTVSVDWMSRTLYDAATGNSILWQDRRLAATSGQSFVDWATVQELKVIGKMMLGGSFLTPNAKLHLDSGNAQASALKFTAGTTTGQTSTDGFDVGITTTGVAEIRQRENLNLELYQNNSIRMQFLTTGTCDASGTSQFRGANGTAAAPTWSFASDTTKGMYHSAANQLSFSVSSTERMRIDSTGKISIYQGTTLRGAMATVYSQINSVGNVGVGEDNLHSTSIPSGGFAANGDCMEVNASGTFAANANNKRVKLKFGAITLFDTAALAFNTGDWEISARIFRTTTTTGKSIVTWTCNNATLTTTVDYQSWAFNFLTANTLVVTGEATSNNDIVQETMQVFWIPVA